MRGKTMGQTGQLDVVFGAGALGRAIARQLLAKGRRVRVVSRGVRDVPAGAEAFPADATDEKAVARACEGATVAYHTATPDYTKWATLYPPIQRGILGGAAAAGVKLVSAESVYMYGRQGLAKGPLTEDMPHVATTRKGRIRAELARMAMEAHEKGKVKVALGRAPDFYGPEATATTIFGDRVFYPAIAGQKVSVMGKLDNPHAFIFIEDFARGLIALGENDRAFGDAWHLPCAPTITQRALLDLIFAAAGHKPNVGEAPALVFKVLGLFVPIMRELAEMLYQWELPYHYSFEKFTKALGPLPVTPHPEAVDKTVAWFVSHPQKK